jgi:hypothetical protein
MKRFRTSITSLIGDVWMVIVDGASELLDFADDDSTHLGASMGRHHSKGCGGGLFRQRSLLRHEGALSG